MILVIRTFILYFLVMFSLRFMGKKQIGQMEPSELTVAIMISELATIPLSETGIPLLNGIVPVLILSAIEILISILVIKSLKFRKLVTGKPVIIVEKGILNEEVLRNTRFTTDDLLTEMRLKGVSNITDIQYAILETGGQVSFILNKENSPITFKDLNINVKEDFMPFPVISKGVLLKENLSIISRDEKWLNNKLKEKGYSDYSQILLLMANHKEIKFIQKKETKK
ncbi:MAG: DUF421 domain-containing protein [Ruminococcaceae bacterium]|nr:DUF421 domain-containing protein [Oscillospiraceae bacterium]